MKLSKKTGRWLTALAVAFLAILLLNLFDPTPIPSNEDKRGYTYQLSQARKEKDRFFQKSVQSPLHAKDRPLFHGLLYFPADTAFRLLGLFISQQETTHASDEKTPAGKIQFVYQRDTFLLTAFWSEKKEKQKYLFVPFRDATSGEMTYGGGRYLDVPWTNDSHVLLDFNYAYNPYCAYNETYVCTLPPAENKLSFSVLAGEKKFHE